MNDTITRFPLLRPRQAMELAAMKPSEFYAQTRNYLARIEALEAKTGRRVDPDSEEALPRANEIAAVRLSEPTIGRDGRSHGGVVRIYRALLLWKLRLSDGGGEAA